MEQTKKKPSILKRILLVLLALVVLVVGIVFFIWRHEIFTVSSIKEIQPAIPENEQGPVYEMKVSGDYYLDNFIEQGGVKNDNELIDFIMKNISKGVIPLNFDAPEIGCAAFNAVTPDGDVLFGRNYDFSKTSSMIVKTNPGGDRLSSISSVDLQFLGIEDGRALDGIMDKATTLAAVYAPIDGMNEEGVAIGVLMTYQGEETVATDQNTDKPDFTTTTMIRMVLDYAHDLDEAIEIMSNYDMHDSAQTSFHFQVADASGRSAVVEWVGETDKTDNDGSKRVMKVHYNDKDEYLGEVEGQNEFQYVTNFILEPGYYESDEDKAGLDRYLQIVEIINPEGENTEGVVPYATALEVLETIGRRSWDKENGKSDSNSLTVWSALYNLTDKTVTWVSNEGFDDDSAIFEYTLN